jgi:DNA-binding NtrC family response regulator
VTKKILVVDDDGEIRDVLRTFLESEGYEVEEAGSCRAAEEALRRSVPDVAVLDFELPDGNALELIPRLRLAGPSAALLILTGHGSIELAVQAIQAGAEQFLTKPVELPALLVVIQRILENQRARQEQLLVKARQSRRSLDPFAGTSAAIRTLEQEARRVLETESPVLIHGETGAGKGVLAHWLHRNGSRSREPFVELNCAGISRELLDSELFGHEKGSFTGATASKPGLLEVAHRGTVFLDEVGDMDLAVQTKLLKVVEEKRFRRMGDVEPRQVDIRLVAATHQDLRELVRERKFREDFYYRLEVLPLLIPPLRERAEDIPTVAREVLRNLAGARGRGEVTLTRAAEEALRGYRWPGNIRELQNVLERALLRSEGLELDAGHLALEAGVSISASPGPDELAFTLEEVERRHIARVLADEGGHVERAARRLGVPRSTLYLRIKGLGLASGPPPAARDD